MLSVNELKSIYCQADRCWRANNFKSCLQFCDQLTRALRCDTALEESCIELVQLKNLVWFLKIKCLSEEYFVDESLLLNEDDIEGDEQIQTFTSTTRPMVTARATTAHAGSRGFDELDRWTMTSGRRIDSSRGQQRTGMLTGRMPTRSESRQSGRATSSYRPLTTSLTATQTAFSRSTRPLLRYSTRPFLSKPIYEYLYNAQKVNNKCTDYRQCLEYLNLVPSLGKKQDQGFHLLRKRQQQASGDKRPNEIQIATLAYESRDGKRDSSQFWSMSNAICYFNLKMHDLAENYFKLALEIEPAYLDPYLWLIKVYLRLNQPLKVLKTCEDGLKNVRSSILYNWKARVQSLLNQNYAAHLSLRESIQFYPTNIEALANVGYYSFYGDKLELSLKCFERVFQLSSSGAGLGVGGVVGSSESFMQNSCSQAELLNNLALANFYCGNYMNVMPLFQRAFLNSPNKETTSAIWYNLSFVPLSFGSHQLAIECLRLALRNDSQNEDAINNLGVLKYDNLINDPLRYRNRQEYWSDASPTRSARSNLLATLPNKTDQRRQQALFDDAETYFCPPKSGATLLEEEAEEESDEADGGDARCDGGACTNEPASRISSSPGMLYNMAVVKRKRGQLLASVRYCRMYLESDPNNHTIRGILNEICEFVAHDS